MLPGSPFLDSLNAGPGVPPGVEIVTLRTPLDAHVLPPESATLRGAEDVEVCCPTHEGLLRDLEVFRIVRRFLSDGVAADDR
jgi:triacylglycerol lipase